MYILIMLILYGLILFGFPVGIVTQLISGQFSGNPGTGIGPVNYGDSVGFDCEVSEDVYNIQITRKVDNNKIIVSQANNTKQTSHLFNIAYSDNKVGFHCRAFHQDGSEAYKSGTKWYSVNLLASSIILTPPPDTQPVPQNTSLSFTCTSNDGLPTPEITWLQHGIELSNDMVDTDISSEYPEGENLYSKATSRMSIVALMELNGLNISCAIMNNMAVIKHYKLQVAFDPTSISLALTPQSPTGRDEWHSLTCTVGGSNPTSVIEWWYDGERLTENEGGIKITPQHDGASLAYSVPSVVGVLQILVGEGQNGKIIECWVKYDNLYVSHLSKSHTIEIRIPTNIYLYIGPALGGTVLLVILITVIIVCTQRKGKRKTKPKEHVQRKKSTSKMKDEEEDKYEYIMESSNLGFDNELTNPKEHIQLHQQASKENTYVRGSSSSYSETYTSSGVGLQSLHQLELTATINEGSYANVKYGNPKHGSGLYLDQKVVAKILKGNAKGFQRQILQSQLHALYVVKKHENLLQFVSFIENKKTLAIIAEYYEVGDLQHFLRTQDNSQNISSRDLIGMSRDVANGMKYLSTHQPPFLHHQLCTRHVLIGPRLTCKVFGFALEDSVRERDKFELKHKLHVDIRWKAPELLQFTQLHSVACDVWSFGVLLYEISSLGNPPYPGLSDDSAVTSYILDQQIMTRPVFVSSTLYEMMRQCWSWNPYNRPTFAALTSDLDYLQTDTQLHIDINTLMQPNISEHLRGAHRHN